MAGVPCAGFVRETFPETFPVTRALPPIASFEVFMFTFSSMTSSMLFASKSHYERDFIELSIPLQSGELSGFLFSNFLTFSWLHRLEKLAFPVKDYK